MRRPTANRDQVITFVFLDSGLCASELYSPKTGELDSKHFKFEINHMVEGDAKATLEEQYKKD